MTRGERQAHHAVARYSLAIARRQNGPVLNRYDRWGYDVGEVAHHPNWTANKADLVRTGFVGLAHHAGRSVPAVVTCR